VMLHSYQSETEQPFESNRQTDDYT
jgi:hypothetical protein